MNIYEYQAKMILYKYGIPVPDGIVILSLKDIIPLIDNFNAKLYVVKAQIYSSGRYKAGGIKFANNKALAKKFSYEMFGMNLITNHTANIEQKVNCIYIERGCNILKEYYFSIVLNRVTNKITLLASKKGGINVEDILNDILEEIINVSIDPAMGIQNFHCREVAYRLDLKGEQVLSMVNIVSRSYKALVDNDAIQIEINPLVLTLDNKLLALDAKIIFDDNAMFRHIDILNLRQELKKNIIEHKAVKLDLNYVKMEGNIGCIVNGAGLAMATIDMIISYGGSPANFLDIGGNANYDKIFSALQIVFFDKSVKCILVNIFGGIIRCDIISQAIIKIIKQYNINIPCVVRFSGTNSILACDILKKSKLELIIIDDLNEAINYAILIASK